MFQSLIERLAKWYGYTRTSKQAPAELPKLPPTKATLAPAEKGNVVYADFKAKTLLTLDGEKPFLGLEPSPGPISLDVKLSANTHANLCQLQERMAEPNRDAVIRAAIIGFAELARIAQKPGTCIVIVYDDQPPEQLILFPKRPKTNTP